MSAELAMPITRTIPARRGRTWRSLAEIAILAALAASSYGLFLNALGYYWDDWRILWLGSPDAPTTILENYAYRPGSAWLFHALNRFVGMDYRLAQCLALASRILGTLVLWRIVRRAWPSGPRAAFAAAALYLVYPGFTQQSISLTYQNYHVGILLCLLSIDGTVSAMVPGRSGGLRLLAVLSSLIFEVLYLLVFDGLVAWEAMRWSLVLVMASRRSTSAWGALGTSLKWAAPYVFVAVGFVVWRALFVTANRGDVNLSTVLREWRSIPLGQLATMVPGRVLSFILDASVFAWSVPAWRGVDYREKVMVIGFAVSAAAAAAAYLGLRRWPAAEGPRSWALGFILVGAVSLAVSATFTCLMKRSLNLETEGNRFVYSAGASAVLLVLGLAGACLGRRGTIAAVTLLVGLSTLSNMAHAYTFKRLWATERTLLWQLAWRAPDIEPGSVVVVTRPYERSWLGELPVSHDANGPLNLHYTSGETPLLALPFDWPAKDLMDSIAAGDHDTVLDNVRARLVAVYDKVPGMRVQEPPGVLLVSLVYPEATLRVVDGDHIDELPEGSGEESRYAKKTRVDLIRGSGPVGLPIERLVGAEPPHEWAWYFQRAELARQLGRRDDWNRLVKDVHSKRLAPPDASEWLVFLEGAIRSDDREAASWIVQQVEAQDRPFLRRVRKWLARLLARVEGPEKALAASIAEDVEKAMPTQKESEPGPGR